MKKAELCLICRATLKYKGTPTFNELQFSFAPRTYEVILEKQDFKSFETVNKDDNSNLYYLNFLVEIYHAEGIYLQEIIDELLVQVTSPEIVECELWDYELLSHS